MSTSEIRPAESHRRFTSLQVGHRRMKTNRWHGRLQLLLLKESQWFCHVLSTYLMSLLIQDSWLCFSVRIFHIMAWFVDFQRCQNDNNFEPFVHLTS